MNNIGAIKYEGVGGSELNVLKKMILDIVNGGYCVQVYPQIEKTFCLIFIDADECDLTKLRLMKTKLISPLRKSSNNGFYIFLFRKHKDDIYFKVKS
jgi:hypothetical protein